MGIKLFSDDPGATKPPNPDPHQFLIFDVHEYTGPYCIARVYFPGCTTYRGYKLLVYATTEAELRSREKIDPHFLGSSRDPIARFPASEAGFRLADTLLHGLGALPAVATVG